MPQELSTEYDIGLHDYLERVEKTITEKHPPTNVRDVDEVVFVDGGPVDFLAWFALDNYDEHVFFYYDEAPNAGILRQFLSMTPDEDEMPKFRVLLQHHYDTFERVDAAALFEIPDTYMPQYTPRPRAIIGFFYSPVDDAIAAGINAIPRTKRDSILEDIGKLLPGGDVERFVDDLVRDVVEELEADIERHVLDVDVRPRLEADPDFQRETTAKIPEGIHPEYSGTDGELWQKPVSRVPYLDGSQGFLQVWLPVDVDEYGLVTVTRGDYDSDTVVERTKDHLLIGIT